MCLLSASLHRIHPPALPAASPAAPPLALPPLLCRRLLQNSFDLLLLASAMREEGYLPASLSLWAVENPMLAPVQRLRQKVDAGAEVVVTQPPLLWDRVQRWAEEADRQLVSRNVKVGTRLSMGGWGAGPGLLVAW